MKWTVGLLVASVSIFLLISGTGRAEESFHDDSEAGVVSTSGNTDTASYDLKQLNTYSWGQNLTKLSGHFLQTENQGQETAKNWNLGLRYERELSERVSAFLGELLEADSFSGYLQRYSSDIGGKYFIFKETSFDWSTELGYRYTIENRFFEQANESFLRLYTEANRAWNPIFSTQFWVEYLPNLSDSTDWQFNTELSGSAMINSIFSLKAGYLVRYRNILIQPATAKTDKQFTTALVAKF